MLFLCILSTCFSILVGCHKSSLSRKAIYSPLAFSIPVLRATETPWFLMNVFYLPWVFFSKIFTIEGDRSLLPSSTITISIFYMFRSSIDCIVSSIYFSALYRGITTDKLVLFHHRILTPQIFMF